MERKECIVITLRIRNHPELAKKWISEMQYFTPKLMSLGNRTNYKMVSYKEKKFLNELDMALEEEEYSVKLWDRGNGLLGIIKNNHNITTMLDVLLEYDIFLSNQEKIYSLINNIMNEAGVVGISVSATDSRWQNNTELEPYKSANRSLEGIPLKKHPYRKGMQAVDVDQLPGHEEVVGGIWFGAVWKMWFHESYYQYVPREGVENFKDCYSNEEISDTCRCITLYQNVLDYEKPENRERQIKFKEAVRFQESVEKLKETVKNMPQNPHMEINKGEFEHGGVKQVRVYLDDDENQVRKEKASKVRIVEYDESDKVIWKDIVIL